MKVPMAVTWRPSNVQLQGVRHLLSIQIVATVASAFYLLSQGVRDTMLVAHALLFGLPVAVTVTLVESILYPPIQARLPFLPGLVARAALLAVSVLVGFAIGLWIYAHAWNGWIPVDPRAGQFVVQEFQDRWVRQASLFVMIALVVYATMSQLTRRLGPGVLGNLLMGRYYRPREEERVFLFIDLKDSTPLAERLGHLTFSALVRDYFAALSPAIVETQAHVLHYVGDEVVLSWPANRGLRKANAIRCYRIAKEVLRRRANRFRQKYGVAPDFKAGLHIGYVVVTEVGDVKTELVFHGDAMNTTARLVAICSELGQDLVMSRALVDRIDLPKRLQVASLGVHRLKGKEKPIEVFGLAGEEEPTGFAVVQGLVEETVQ